MANDVAQDQKPVRPKNVIERVLRKNLSDKVYLTKRKGLARPHERSIQKMKPMAMKGTLLSTTCAE
jgi:hypothetical protein